MNLVDIIHHIPIYTHKNRHISYANNISHWINNEYININTKKIVNNYKHYLNKQNVNIILLCIRYKIIIIPILYKFTIDEIKLMINYSFTCVNINMIKFNWKLYPN